MVDLSKSYWDEQYSDPQSIDGIGNAKDHSRYLRAFFELEGFQIKTLLDLGFGPGQLFKEMIRTFRPKKALGLEPSTHIFEKFRPAPGVRVLHTDILQWCQRPSSQVYDLALCTSVLQYLSDRELKAALPILATRIRYLYLTVPTDVEYQRQNQEQAFRDPYAKVRTRSQYLRLLRPHFTFLSLRVLESKHFYSERNTPFNDLLFRF